MHGYEMKQIAMEGAKRRFISIAQPCGALDHGVEHRRELAGRGIDDLQHLGGCGLLLQGLARLGQEPRVLHRDDRLRGEILQQRDLFFGERPDLLSVERDRAKCDRVFA